MYYIIGDIHGFLDKLTTLMKIVAEHIKEDDTLIFLGDYIDRGEHSYEVIEILLDLSHKYNTVFLSGNHENMLLGYLKGNDSDGMFLYNGGRATIKSYERNLGKFKLPHKHETFYNELGSYYEGEDFIAVHAGLNPNVEKLSDQSSFDMLWIREEFIFCNRRWGKTVIFGHTPVSYITGTRLVHIDDERNIIGIDSGVIFGRQLSCLRWPDREVFLSE